MTHRIISVSAAPYDGHPLSRILASLAQIGATHVEPVFAAAYKERFHESAFSLTRAAEYAAAMHLYGIQCHAVSAHVDLGRADADTIFRNRLDFAKRLGARVVNTCTTTCRREKQFYANIEGLVRHAEALGIWIGLENPGDGSDSMLNVAADAQKLLARISSPNLGLNYDVGNIASHRPAMDSVRDAMEALPYCVHMHLKDVCRHHSGWFFKPIGRGDIRFGKLWRAIAGTEIPLSIDIPMRLHRGIDGKLGRAPYCVPLTDIESTLRASLRYVRRHLGLSNEFTNTA